MHLIQNLFLWIDRFLLHKQTNNSWFHYSIYVKNNFSLFTKINSVLIYQYFIISIQKWTYISIEYYYVLTNPTAIRHWKKSTHIKSETISSMEMLIRVNILVKVTALCRRFPNAKPAPTYCGYKFLFF